MVVMISVADAVAQLIGAAGVSSYQHILHVQFLVVDFRKVVYGKPRLALLIQH
jgi:hypothetical protein